MTDQELAQKIADCMEEDFIQKFGRLMGFEILMYHRHSCGVEATLSIKDYMKFDSDLKIALRMAAAKFWGVEYEKVVVGAYPKITPNAVVFYAVFK